MFSHAKDFMAENGVETSDTGIDQCIKDHMVVLQSRFSKNFSEAVSDKCKWIPDLFWLIHPKIMTFLLNKKKELILTIYQILL
jgi:hypothetical protein